MVVIEIDGMNKDIDDGSTLNHIVGGHLADIVQKRQNLCLGQRDLFVFLNSELCLQLRLFRHALVAEQVAEAVGAEFLAEGGLDPAPFQIPDDLRFRLAAGVALINLTDNSPLVSRLA